MKPCHPPPNPKSRLRRCIVVSCSIRSGSVSPQMTVRRRSRPFVVENIVEHIPSCTPRLPTVNNTVVFACGALTESTLVPISMNSRGCYRAAVIRVYPVVIVVVVIIAIITTRRLGRTDPCPSYIQLFHSRPYRTPFIRV